MKITNSHILILLVFVCRNQALKGQNNGEVLEIT